MPLIHCNERRSALLDRTSPRVSLSSHKAFFSLPKYVFCVIKKRRAVHGLCGDAAPFTNSRAIVALNGARSATMLLTVEGRVADNFHQQWTPKIDTLKIWW